MQTAEATGIGKAQANPFVKNSKVLVSKVDAVVNVKENIRKAVDLIGGFDKVIEKGDEILLKPSYNSSGPPPAANDPEFVKALIELLCENGAAKVIVGESSMEGRTTRKVMEKTGVLEKIKDAGAEMVFFDEGNWTKVYVGGKYLKVVSLPEKAVQAQKLVYCCNMKTHFRADFSLSLKLGFGFVKGSERLLFHLEHLKEKLAEMNLVIHPDLIIMDGRKCFITGGPFSGIIREPNVVLASGDRIAIDVEAVKILGSFEGSELRENPWSYPLIRRAVEIGLGVKNEQGYEVIAD